MTAWSWWKYSRAFAENMHETGINMREYIPLRHGVYVCTRNIHLPFVCSSGHQETTNTENDENDELYILVTQSSYILLCGQNILPHDHFGECSTVFTNTLDVGHSGRNFEMFKKYFGGMLAVSRQLLDVIWVGNWIYFVKKYRMANCRVIK